MAYSEYLADRVKQRMGDKAEVKKMMGGLIFMVNGKMCMGVDIDKRTKEDRIMARIGKDHYEPSLDEKGCRKMDFTGKPMKGFVFVYPEGFDSDVDLDKWCNRALEFNRKLVAE